MFFVCWPTHFHILQLISRVFAYPVAKIFVYRIDKWLCSHLLQSSCAPPKQYVFDHIREYIQIIRCDDFQTLYTNKVMNAPSLTFKLSEIYSSCPRATERKFGMASCYELQIDVFCTSYYLCFNSYTCRTWHLMHM